MAAWQAQWDGMTVAQHRGLYLVLKQAKPSKDQRMEKWQVRKFLSTYAEADAEMEAQKAHIAATLAQENKAEWKAEFDSWTTTKQDRRVAMYKTKPKTGPLRATEMELAMMQCVARPNALHPPRAHATLAHTDMLTPPPPPPTHTPPPPLPAGSTRSWTPSPATTSRAPRWAPRPSSPQSRRPARRARPLRAPRAGAPRAGAPPPPPRA